jgi:hypothetical protein
MAKKKSDFWMYTSKNSRWVIQLKPLNNDGEPTANTITNPPPPTHWEHQANMAIYGQAIWVFRRERLCTICSKWSKYIDALNPQKLEPPPRNPCKLRGNRWESSKEQTIYETRKITHYHQKGLGKNSWAPLPMTLIRSSET